MAETALDVLHDLRRRRKRHRLGDIEWFDAAYRVYLVALFCGGTVLWISSSISDSDASAQAIALAQRILHLHHQAEQVGPRAEQPPRRPRIAGRGARHRACR